MKRNVALFCVAAALITGCGSNNDNDDLVFAPSNGAGIPVSPSQVGAPNNAGFGTRLQLLEQEQAALQANLAAAAQNSADRDTLLASLQTTSLTPQQLPLVEQLLAGDRRTDAILPAYFQSREQLLAERRALLTEQLNLGLVGGQALSLDLLSRILRHVQTLRERLAFLDAREAAALSAIQADRAVLQQLQAITVDPAQQAIITQLLTENEERRQATLAALGLEQEILLQEIELLLLDLGDGKFQLPSLS